MNEQHTAAMGEKEQQLVSLPEVEKFLKKHELVSWENVLEFLEKHEAASNFLRLLEKYPHPWDREFASW